MLCLAKMGSGAFKRNMFTHRHGPRTSCKKFENVFKSNTKPREKIMEDDLAIKVNLSLRTSFAETGNLEREQASQFRELIARTERVD